MSADEEKEIDKEFRQNRWQFVAIIIAYGELALLFLYSKTKYEFLIWVCLCGLLACLFVAIYAFGFLTTNFWRQGRQAIKIRRTSNDRLFNKIDYIEKNRNNKTNFNVFSVINYYYFESEEMKSLVDNGEIERLLIRQDYLQHKLHRNTPQEVKFCWKFIMWVVPTIFSGSFLSDVVNIVSNNIDFKIFMVGIVLVVVNVIFVSLSQRGQLGIYFKEINEYELELLQSIIRQMENSMHIDQSGIGLFNMQQLVINTLKKKIGWIKISSKKKEMAKQLRIIRNMKFEQPPSSMYMLMHFENNESFIYYKPIVTPYNYKDDYVVMSEIIEQHKKEIEKMYNKIRSKNIISYCKTDHHTG